MIKAFNLVQDIADICKYNKEHDVRVTVDGFGVTVHLAYDPECDGEDNIILPIRYDTLDEFAYISDSEYRKLFNPNDYGMDMAEIYLVYKIGTYLEEHKDEIDKLCSSLNVYDKNDKEDSNMDKTDKNV